MKTREVVASATRMLRDAGVASPEVDARLIIEHVLSCERLMWPSEIDDEQYRAIARLVRQRAERIPLQHLLGVMWFLDFALEARPGVFCVRPETEVLAERLQRWCLDHPGARILDLCTGSGAIAIAAARADHRAEVSAVDISARAIASAQRNAQHLGVSVDWHCVDAGDTVTGWIEYFDVVVSNPPYIPRRDLDPEALADPPAALWGGGEDGLEIPRIIIDQATRYLRPGGWMMVEHDDTQAEALADHARTLGLATIQTVPDLAGRPRFLTASKMGQ